jgi:hypothetical protein
VALRHSREQRHATLRGSRLVPGSNAPAPGGGVLTERESRPQALRGHPRQSPRCTPRAPTHGAPRPHATFRPARGGRAHASGRRARTHSVPCPLLQHLAAAGARRCPPRARRAELARRGGHAAALRWCASAEADAQP